MNRLSCHLAVIAAMFATTGEPVRAQTNPSSPAPNAPAQAAAAIAAADAIEADPSRLSSFCWVIAQLSKADGMSDEAVTQFDAKVQDLGPDFEAGGELDPGTPEGQAFEARVVALTERCDK
ncbi:MAG: hypothetical protein K2Y05_02010 [Hyphomicrobiaceae bacterium]|nr:hypothetical protein [Hyphomicrobiaceae bacterium]